MIARIEIVGHWSEDNREKRFSSLSVYEKIVKDIIEECVNPSNEKSKLWAKGLDILMRNCNEILAKKTVNETPKSFYQRQRAEILKSLIPNFSEIVTAIKLTSAEQKLQNSYLAPFLSQLFENYYHIDWAKGKYISIGDSLSSDILSIDDSYYKNDDEKRILDMLIGNLFIYKYRVLSRDWQHHQVIFYVSAFVEDDLFETNMLYSL